MAPRLRAVLGRERAARGRFETERGELQAIRVGIEAEAVRDRQPRVAERREVRGLRAEAGGVGGLGEESGTMKWHVSKLKRSKLKVVSELRLKARFKVHVALHLAL